MSEDITISDPDRGLELTFVRNQEGLVISIEVAFHQPRPLMSFVNLQAVYQAMPQVMGPGPVNTGTRRGCGGK